LLNVPITFNGFRYACFLSNGICSINSSDALLTVDSTLFIQPDLTRAGLIMNLSPNPFTVSTTVNYYLPGDGVVHFLIFNIFGQIIFEVPETFETKGAHSYLFDNLSLTHGMYLCQLDYSQQDYHTSLIMKMIKK
jgi:hypothetical protein